MHARRSTAVAHDAPLLSRRRLRAGVTVAGPALIAEYSATTLLAAGRARRRAAVGRAVDHAGDRKRTSQAPCPCSSGRRYKSCCYAATAACPSRSSRRSTAPPPSTQVLGVLPLVESSRRASHRLRRGCSACCANFGAAARPRHGRCRLAVTACVADCARASRASCLRGASAPAPPNRTRSSASTRTAAASGRAARRLSGADDAWRAATCPCNDGPRRSIGAPLICRSVHAPVAADSCLHDCAPPRAHGAARLRWHAAAPTIGERVGRGSVALRERALGVARRRCSTRRCARPSCGSCC